MNKAILQQLNQRPIAYYPIYRQLTGSTTAGILLSQMMYWFSKKDKFFKTDSELMEETMLSERELKTAKIVLKKLNFLTITREGIPAKTYYHIDWQLYENSIQASSDETSQQVRTNRPNCTGQIVQTVSDESSKLYKNNNLITETTTETTNREKKEKDKSFSQKIKNFSFSLSKKFSFEALSKEYQDRLYAYAISKDSADSFEAFKDYHCSVGSKFKNWSRAYNTWLRNKEQYGQSVSSPILAKSFSGEDIYLSLDKKFAVKKGDDSYKLLEITAKKENYSPPEPIPKQIEPANKQEFQNKLRDLTKRVRL